MHAQKFPAQIFAVAILFFKHQFGFKVKFSHGIAHVRSSGDFLYLNILTRKIFCSVSINEFIIKISEKNTETYPNNPVLNVCTLVC